MRRSHIFEDAFRHFSFDITKILKVRFIGDSAIDDGGPRREFFQLLIQAIANKSGMFSGYPSHVVPLHDVDALIRNKYFIVGKMIAAGIVQGGQPPVYFANAVADFIVFNSVKSSVDIQDIADIEIRHSLEKVRGKFCTNHLVPRLSLTKMARANLGVQKRVVSKNSGSLL